VESKTEEIKYTEWNQWEAQGYLTEYYGEVMPDERFAMEWLVESMRNAGPVPLALDFGSGPTVHHLFPLVPYVAEFHLCEYLPNNRTEVGKWLRNEEGAHDWLQFALETLRLEGNSNPTKTPPAPENKWSASASRKFFPATRATPTLWVRSGVPLTRW
jgi:hypothetical protein